ncbi:hypothetical protein NP493_802g01012 [Ridgeia piscesae]|uniref:Sorting nexin-13 n=1 Tax=Ridgeia piscesae TaxID=27915 RepID=A0AAD9KN31_RIDPI|nr:hypothetical protein NP493_802g01012 [Ridgeia piscesae]
MALWSRSTSWVVLGIAFVLTTFGPVSFLWLILCGFSFIVGALVMLFQHGRAKGQTWWRESGSMKVSFPPMGLPLLVEDLRRGGKKIKADKRMTGSSIIDEVLQEVLDYTYRDYIHSWYRRISDDEKFRYDMRMTLQRVIIALSERAKDVDLVPYLTTYLVDDFASHIKLYRQALERVKAHQKDDTKPPPDLEAIFFDLETEMEKNLCRDAICLSDESERQYLQDLSEALLFLLLPPEDFHNKPFRYIVREVLVNGVFLPTFNLISDPDYINQAICSLCGEAPLTNDCFLLTLKTTDSVDELEAVKEKVDLDIARQRSKDSGGEDDVAVKRQLSSLLYVKGVCEKRIQQLHDGLDEPDLLPVGLDMNKLMVPGHRLYSLPFDGVLHNNVALSYFLEFMTSIGAQGYIFFYLTVEGYRVSTEQQMSVALLAEDGSTSHAEMPDLEMVRDAAISIYNQYLSEKVSPRLSIDAPMVKVLRDRIYYDQPTETVFDEVQARVWDILQDNPKYFPAFRKSQLYIKLLAELDLLKEGATRLDDCDNDSDSSRSSDHRGSAEDLLSSGESSSSNEPTAKGSDYTLTAHISTTGGDISWGEHAYD